jgi:hypothetical protein
MDTFHWSLPGLSGQEFHALTNALLLKSGGQLEPTFSEVDKAEDVKEANDAASEETTRLDQLSNSSAYEKLKKTFLDRLAELAANEKRAGAVACTAMRELEDGIVVWVARNEGFKNEDNLFFDDLASRLAEFSRREDDSVSSLSQM